MKKILLAAWLTVFPIFVCHGQQTKAIDSLKQLLIVQKDTSRLNTLYKLFTTYVRNTPDSSKVYMEMLLDESTKTDHEKFLGLAYKAEGLYHYYSSDYRQAKKSYGKSITIYENLGLKVPLSRMYNNQGIVLKYLGELKESKAAHLKSLKIKEDLKLSPEDIAASLVNLGVLEHELGNNELSTEYYSRAEKICIDNNIEHGLNLVRMNLAGNLKDKKEYTSALAYYDLVLINKKRIIEI